MINNTVHDSIIMARYQSMDYITFVKYESEYFFVKYEYFLST